jgi:cephalosporin hydroxylase
VSPLVDTAQTTWELTQMVGIAADLQPDRILEIGVWEGGTLAHWLRHANTVTAVDDTMRDPGPDEWHRWADAAGTTLHLLQGDSRDPDIVDSVRRRGPYQFILIDGDHTYQAVKADWWNYRPMVDQGGVVCLHDIVARPDYGVPELWGEIKAEPGARTVEIVENSGRYNGIGVVYL